jgi:predicted dehydrogenase
MTQKKPLSIGFIGGSIESAVGQTHQIASQMDRRWKLVAGCFSRQPGINKKTAEHWGLTPKQTYNNWIQLLENEKDKLDAIAVLTPTPSHTEIVIKALSMGYAVICEKALTSSTEQAKQIAVTLKHSKGFLAITYNYSGYPMVRELQALIKMGTLGKVQQVHIEMPQEGFLRLNSQGEPNQPQQWRLEDHKIPTISLDLGLHTHHLISFLTGEKPLSVVSSQTNLGHFPDIIDNVMCIARYTNQLQCQFWYSKTALGHRNGLRLRVYGTKASAEWFQLNPEELTLNHNNGSREIIDRASRVTMASEQRYNRFKAGHPSGFIEAFANLYSDIADSLTHYKKNKEYSHKFVYGIDHALEGCDLFDAINQSSKNKKWINIE